MGNCRKCNDRWLIFFYPKTSTMIEVECPRCHEKYDLLVEGEDEKTARLYPRELEKVQKNMEVKYYHEPDEDDISEYEKETAPTRGMTIEMHKTYGTSARFLNDTGSLKAWDKVLEEKFARASFNPSHLHRYKSRHVINWTENKNDAENA